MNDSAINMTSPDSALSASGANSTRLGWTGGPNSRGTMDIIWGCALTMFLCCWSILIINVPIPGSSFSWILFQKFQLLCLCLLAPEIVFQMALGQFLSAQRSTAGFHKAGYHEWGLRHSFYVDMGAIHLRSPDFKSFPIDAKQLLYLIEHGYVKYPQIDESAIKDKNKIDGMLRAITLVQAMWFVINLIARAIQRLAISCLELSTSAWVIFCIGITICWSKKAADVELREFIDTATPLAQILREADDAAQRPYYNTPLEFISREEWPWSKLWYHGLGYLKAWKLVKMGTERPVQRFGDTAISIVGGWWYMLFIFATLSYFSVFLVAWNFSFPSRTERLLWRIAALGGPLSALGVAFTIHFCMSWTPRWKEKWQARKMRNETNRQSVDVEANDVEGTASTVVIDASNVTDNPETLGQITSTTSTTSGQSRSSRASDQRLLSKVVSRSTGWLRNNSTLKDPALTCPLRVIVLVWLFGLLYCYSRLYIIVEDLMELRSLPASAYDTVDWTKFWPHF